jgi:hypothetical protein
MINSIIARQSEELRHIYNQNLLQRELDIDVDKRIIKVITGVRRSGKSVLAFLLLKDRKFGYVNFDDRLLCEIKNPDEILSAIREIYGRVKILFLDEIQNLEKWELWVSSLNRSGYNLIISGSNARLLSKELSTHLTGRYLEFDVLPFSFREYLRWKNIELENIDYLHEAQGMIKHELNNYILEGGFPEIIVKGLGEEYLRTLFEAIVYKDVAKRWNVRYLSRLEDLARYLIANAPLSYTFSRLKKILNFRSKITVENYVKYIEESYLIFSLERFSFKIKERIVSPKKCYAIDTGLINAVSTKASRDIGRLMENTVFLELRRKHRENRELFYYSDSYGNEVDFVIKKGLEIKQLIQVSYSLDDINTKNREMRNLTKASQNLRCNNLLIITWDYEAEEEITWRGTTRRIKFLPLWKFMIKGG